MCMESAQGFNSGGQENSVCVRVCAYMGLVHIMLEVNPQKHMPVTLCLLVSEDVVHPMVEH